MVFKRRLGFESLETRRLLTAVDIPDDLMGNVLAQVTAPVNIDNASGIRAAEIRVTYDTTILDITEADVLVGSVWASDPAVDIVTSVNDAAGTIVVSIFGANALPATNGSLVQFRFTIQAGATVGSSAVLDLTRVRLNEGTISLDTNPQAGPDATDGRITVTATPPGNATVSGTVYADVNNNNQPDSTEGLPGVRITLVNTATNAQVQTTTQSSGRYEFTNLAPGSYRIQERQPAAYLDGGPNEISVTLVGGQTLTGQDFRELGLRPEFVYNRLFTTLVMPIGSSNWVAAITKINTDAESGVVNAQIVPATTSGLRAEGEAPTFVSSHFASDIAVPKTVLAAEGEASVVPTMSTRLPSTKMARTVVATPPTVNSEPPVATNSPVESGAASSSEPAVDLANFVWSENAGSPDAGSTTKSHEGEHLSEIADELLAIDELFAATDSW